MNIEKLKPWNWFRHETTHEVNQIPVNKSEAGTGRHLWRQDDPFLRIHQEMDRMFDDAFRSFGLPNITARAQRDLPALGHSAGFFQPQVDISADKNQYEISVDLPGLNDVDVHLELQENILTIRGEKEEVSENEDKKFYRVERHYGSFQRTLALPDDADADAIKADMKQGVLKISIPKKETPESVATRIPIQH